MTGAAGGVGPAGQKGDVGANGRDGSQGQKVRPHPLIPARSMAPSLKKKTT